jgi:hypothetical protein
MRRIAASVHFDLPSPGDSFLIQLKVFANVTSEKCEKQQRESRGVTIIVRKPLKMHQSTTHAADICV